jgi:septum site-determining protein MinD
MKAAKAAEDIGIEVKGVIVTRVKGTGSEMPIANIQDMLELPILGIVPEDKNVPTSVVQKDALIYTHPKSRASRAYRKIAARIIGKDDYKDKGVFWDWLTGKF